MHRAHTSLCIASLAIGCLMGVSVFDQEDRTRERHNHFGVGKAERHDRSSVAKGVPSETSLMISNRWDCDADEISEFLRRVPGEDRINLLPRGNRNDGILLCARLLDLSWDKRESLLGNSFGFFQALRHARDENPLVFREWLQSAIAEGRAEQLAKGWWDCLDPQGKRIFVETLLPMSVEHPELLDSPATAQSLETADVPQLTVALRGLEKLEPTHHVTRAVRTAVDRIAALDPVKAAEILASTSNPDIREALMKKLPAQVTDNLISSLPPDRREGVFAAQAAQVLSGDAPVAEVAASLGRMSTTGELDSKVKEVVSGFLERSADATRVYDAAILIEDETLRSAFIQQTTANLAQIDPYEASSQLDRVMQSGHTVPDTAIVALIGQIRMDQEACRIWASHIADPNLKQEMLSKYTSASGVSSK